MLFAMCLLTVPGLGRHLTAKPLVTSLFPGYEVTAKTRLWHIAYLFYRAKKDDAWCGGNTTAIYLPRNGDLPMYIAIGEMKEAELLGQHFDMYLRETLKHRIMAATDEDLEGSMASLAQVMKMTSSTINSITFYPLGTPTLSTSQTSEPEQ